MGDYDDGGMSETSTSEEGALSQIGSSLKNVLVGIVCFIAAWPVLYCGASRVQWQKVFKKAAVIEQAKAGEPAYTIGVPVAAQIGDANLATGNYLKILKTPEVYAYVENKKTSSKTKRKGVTRKKVTTKKTTYSYEKKWTSSPTEISSFNQKFWNRYRGQQGISTALKNPVLTEKAESINSPNCTVNGYKVNVADISFYGGSQEMDAVYVKGIKGAPQIGDKRINYSVYPSNISYTFAGTASGKSIVPYDETDDDSKLAANPGDFKALLKSFKSEDNMKFWLYFLGGFILMAAGLNMMVGPITTLLEFIPFLGTMGSGLIKFTLTLVALILSAVFYFLVHYWWIILILIAAAGAGIYFLKKKKAAPAAA